MKRFAAVLLTTVLLTGCGVIPGMRGSGPAPTRGDYEVLMQPASRDELNAYHVVEVTPLGIDGVEGVTSATAQGVRGALVRDLLAMSQVTLATAVPAYARMQVPSRTIVITGNVVERTETSDGRSRLSVRVRCLDKATGRVMLEALLHASTATPVDAEFAAGVADAAVRMMERSGDWKR